jgi:hypothetical protein
MPENFPIAAARFRIALNIYKWKRVFLTSSGSPTVRVYAPAAPPRKKRLFTEGEKKKPFEPWCFFFGPI